MEFKFKYNEKEYILNEQNLEYFVNDEVNPIMDVNEEKIIEILNNSDKVDFSKAYFDLPCENCKTGLEEKKKFFDFLGFNFYIYAKDRKYVVSTLDREYEGMSFNRLQKSGKVNESYIVIINVCKHCGSYSIEIEEFEV
ncbi:MAG: DUF3785 family protein [Clostridium saudiense]|jgi:hypothetical protein|uniref:Protein of uncharacterized function (DUF3785) n=1 Tax=Clostridium disporicum TaxID=84024 RepID=A0A174IAI9_9CLOT|nr:MULTISPECIES: DUF3785 family protein [Clostridium]MBX9186439.1 DUF3785 family protein [Clostridium sp. K04]CUO82637.1 Protein of uncharacterised function (DUF3785) [Clostridium disporicum]